MKFKSNTLLAPLSKATIRKLTQVVDETVDSEFVSKTPNRKLTVAEVWMIHKQKRIFETRRFI